MLKFGLVDLDTSHPQAWTQAIREIGEADVVACWDGGGVYEKGYAEIFAQKNGIPTVCSTLREMADLVDVAIIHSCNWDLHIERATPFLDAGKGVVLDKPMVGNLKDINKLYALVRTGYNIIGGSSMRYAKEIQSFLESLPEKGEIVNVFATMNGDFFGYGIHGIEMLQGLTGLGITDVCFLGGKGLDVFDVNYSDGRKAILQLRGPEPYWHMTVTTTKGVYSVDIQFQDLYKNYLRKVIDHFTGKKEIPYSLVDCLESIKVALACADSRVSGRRVRIDELRLDNKGFDGYAYEEEYRISKLPKAR